jgi:hypothetical protein
MISELADTTARKEGKSDGFPEIEGKKLRME